MWQKMWLIGVLSMDNEKEFLEKAPQIVRLQFTLVNSKVLLTEIVKKIVATENSPTFLHNLW